MTLLSHDPLGARPRKKRRNTSLYSVFGLDGDHRAKSCFHVKAKLAFAEGRNKSGGEIWIGGSGVSS